MDWHMISGPAQLLGALAAITHLCEFVTSHVFKKNAFCTW